MGKAEIDSYYPNIKLDRDGISPLHLQLSDGIAQQIKRRRLPCGTPLPSERKLAELLGISRGTVRKAYAKLLDELIVEPLPRNGTLAISFEAQRMHSSPDFPAIGIILSVKPSQYLQLTRQSAGMDYFSAVMDAASEAGFSLTFLSPPEKNDPENSTEEWIEHVVSRLTGLIYFSIKEGVNDLLYEHLLAETCLPQLFMTGYSSLSHIISVTADESIGVMAAVGHLLELGHRRIGTLIVPTVQSKYFHNQSCRRGEHFLTMLKAAGVPPPPEWIIDVSEQQADVEAAIKQVYSGPESPTALLCHNDKVAIAAITALNKIGFRVPEDVSIIGYDDVPLAATMDPAITTVRQPRQLIGRECVRILSEYRRTAVISKGSQQTLPSALVVRSSTASARPDKVSRN